MMEWFKLKCTTPAGKGQAIKNLQAAGVTIVPVTAVRADLDHVLDWLAYALEHPDQLEIVELYQSVDNKFVLNLRIKEEKPVPLPLPLPPITPLGPPVPSSLSVSFSQKAIDLGLSPDEARHIRPSTIDSLWVRILKQSKK